MASPGQGFSAGNFGVFSELVTTTFRNHSKEVADNVTKHNALYKKLSDGGKIRLEDGGRRPARGGAVPHPGAATRGRRAPGPQARHAHLPTARPG